MTGKSTFALALAASTALALSTTAFAEGKTDQARKAIAAAQAKVDAMNIVGAAGDAPRLHAEALVTLHRAQDELAHHAKDDAIRDATHASELADMALAASQRERNDAQQAATAQAQHQAAAAQAAAAAAQADATAARAAPPVVIQTPAPAPTATTVTTTQTEETAAAPRAKKKPVVHHRAAAHRRAATHTKKITTTVTTATH